MKKRGQVSTEYLIVFGIAFMIIITGTFAFLKFAKSGVFSKQQCIIVEPGIECEGFAKDYSFFTTMISCVSPTYKDQCMKISLKNTLDENIFIHNLKLKDYTSARICTDPSCGGPTPITVPSKGSKVIYIIDSNNNLNPSSKINTDFTVEYSIGLSTSFRNTLTGYISGKLLPEP